MTPAPGEYDPDDTQEFPPVSDDEGPVCGTPQAATRFLVVFIEERGVQFAEHDCCCYRHVPHPVQVLPEGAQLLEVVIQDAQLKTVLTDRGAEITIGGETIFIPAHL